MRILIGFGVGSEGLIGLGYFDVPYQELKVGLVCLVSAILLGTRGIVSLKLKKNFLSKQCSQR